MGNQKNSSDSTLTQCRFVSAVWPGTHNIPHGDAASGQSSLDEHFVAPTLRTVLPLLSMDRGKSISHNHEQSLSRRHRNWGQPGASEERGDALVFPKQLLHLHKIFYTMHMYYLLQALLYLMPLKHQLLTRVSEPAIPST